MCVAADATAVMTSNRKSTRLPYFSSHVGPTTSSNCIFPLKCSMLLWPKTCVTSLSHESADRLRKCAQGQAAKNGTVKHKRSWVAIPRLVRPCCIEGQEQNVSNAVAAQQIRANASTTGELKAKRTAILAKGAQPNLPVQMYLVLTS